MWSLATRCAFIICISIILTNDVVNSRRFGGGFRSFRSVRTSRTSYSYGNTRYSRNTRYGSSYRSGRSTRYNRYAAAFAVGYTVYGMSRYRTRFYGTRYYREDPNICTNMERYATYENGTISKTQKLDYFVCPYESTDSESDVYCCGPELSQYCCSYWKSGKKVGAIVGIVIATLVLICVVVICVKKCHGRRSKAPPTAHPTAHYQPPTDALLVTQGVPDNYDDRVPGNNANGYYPNPGAAMVNPPAPAAPAAPAAGSTPYPLNPTAPYEPYPAPITEPKAIGFEATAPPNYDTAVNYPTKD